MNDQTDNTKVEITEEDKTYLLDHDYDGIKECNYPLPFWWVGIFWATIIFSIPYVIYYHMAGGPTLLEEFKQEMKIVKLLRGEGAAKSAAAGFDMTAYNSADLAAGKTKYTQVCAACHGQNGEGSIGPNFGDSSWLYGNTPEDILKTIKKGTAKGMPPYGNMLKPAELMAVTKYVKSFEGTNPPNGKAPQGKKY